MATPPGVDPDDYRRLAVDAANRAIGILAAKARGDDADLEMLFASFEGDNGAIASGFIWAAEMLLVQLRVATGLDTEVLLRQIALDVERTFPPQQSQ